MQRLKSRTVWLVLVIGAMGSLASAGAGQLRADGAPHGLQAPERAALRPVATRVVGDDPLIDPVSEQGQRARGLYFSAPVYRRLGAKGIIRKLRAANMDAAVLDMKDGEGRVNYDTQIPSLQSQKHHYIDDMPAFIAELKAGGIYVIARVVCYSDPYLPRNEPDRAVMDNRPRKAGVVWANWGHRNTWLDPYNPKNHQLIADIAKEVEALGVNEIQLDYVRFPVDDATVFAMFPAQVDKPRREVLIDMLKKVDETIHIPLGCDVFGLTALRRGDPAGLGQSLEDWVPYVEVFSPMLYINGMNSLIKRGGPARAERLVFAATNTLRERVGPTPVIRPFLQGFSVGADYYTPEFIAEQVRGVHRANGDGFLFWHPGSNYKMVQQGMVGPAMGMNPLPLGGRAAKRRELWGEALAARDQVAAGTTGAQAASATASTTALKTAAPAAARVRAARTRPRIAPRARLQVRVPPGAMPETAVPAAAADTGANAVPTELAPPLQPAVVPPAAPVVVTPAVERPIANAPPAVVPIEPPGHAAPAPPTPTPTAPTAEPATPAPASGASPGANAPKAGAL